LPLVSPIADILPVVDVFPVDDALVHDAFPVENALLALITIDVTCRRCLLSLICPVVEIRSVSCAILVIGYAS
jgi:hypothetical protein